MGALPRGTAVEHRDVCLPLEAPGIGRVPSLVSAWTLRFEEPELPPCAERKGAGSGYLRELHQERGQLVRLDDLRAVVHHLVDPGELLLGDTAIEGRRAPEPQPSHPWCRVPPLSPASPG